MGACWCANNIPACLCDIHLGKTPMIAIRCFNQLLPPHLLLLCYCPGLLVLFLYTALHNFPEGLAVLLASHKSTAVGEQDMCFAC